MSVFDGLAETSCYRLLSAAASDNATAAISRPCAVKTIHGYNAKGANIFLKLYDETTSPVSTDTPVKTVCIPATTAFLLAFDAGFVFKTGLGFRITTGVADNDTGVLIAADVLALNIDYV